MIDFFVGDKCQKGFPKLKTYLLEIYYDTNKCTSINCYICKKTKNYTSELIKLRESKIEKLNNKINKKAAEKSERYSRLKRCLLRFGIKDNWDDGLSGSFQTTPS